MKKLLQYIGAGPVTILGLLYVKIFSLMGWYTYAGKFGDALVWTTNQSKLPDFMQKLWKDWGGHTVGQVVVLKKPEIDKTILIHEQEHVRQFMVLGIFQPILYAICSIAIKIGCKKSDWYYSNPFEIEARRAAGQVVDVESFIGRVKK